MQSHYRTEITNAQQEFKFRTYNTNTEHTITFKTDNISRYTRRNTKSQSRQTTLVDKQDGTQNHNQDRQH
jgi:hypothetical protein